MPVVVLFLIFVALLVIAVPVSITLGITSVLPSVFDPSFTVGAKYLIRAMFGGLDSFPLLAVPMFVLSGIIMAKGGISKKLFDVFAYFLGKFTAGMPCAVIVTCLFYGAISGSAPATVAAVGSMTIPILTTLGYDLTFSTAIVAVAGGLGVIIPPSIPFIMYGMASGASVSDLFLAGIVPGLMIGLLLMVYAVYHCKRYGEDKEKIHAEVKVLHDKGLLCVLKESFFALLSPVIILGCIYSGVASPTEAAVHSGGIDGIFPCADADAGTADGQRVYPEQLPQPGCDPSDHQRIPADCRNGDGYHTGNPDSDPDPSADRTGNRYGSNSVWCDHGCQPCDRLRNTADRRQPVRGKLPDRGSGHADRKEGYADDRFLPRGTAADYIYSGDFDWNFIGRSEGQ